MIRDLWRLFMSTPKVHRLSTVATMLSCIAAVLLPVTPYWVPVALIVTALGLTYWGLVEAQRMWDDLLEADVLMAKWRQQRDRRV